MRTKRVSEEIQKVISERLIRGLRDPLPGFVTVRDVEVNRDFTRAKVFYSVIGSDEDKRGAAAVLEQEKGQLRREIGKKIRLRNTPELVFIADDSGERAARIHQLLNEAHASDAAAAAASDDADDADDVDDEDDEDGDE